jgi:hypothetical protein
MSRGTIPLVGVVLLVALTVAAGAVVAAGALGVEPHSPADRVALEVAVDAGGNRIALTHAGGTTLDVRELSLTIRIEGEPLTHQTPIPYFAAPGFVGAPTGPINSGGDPDWSTGERATLRIAATNEPRPGPGDRMTVELAGERAALARVGTEAT